MSARKALGTGPLFPEGKVTVSRGRGRAKVSSSVGRSLASPRGSLESFPACEPLPATTARYSNSGAGAEGTRRGCTTSVALRGKHGIVHPERLYRAKSLREAAHEPARSVPAGSPDGPGAPRHAPRPSPADLETVLAPRCQFKRFWRGCAITMRTLRRLLESTGSIDFRRHQLAAKSAML